MFGLYSGDVSGMGLAYIAARRADTRTTCQVITHLVLALSWGGHTIYRLSGGPCSAQAIDVTRLDPWGRSRFFAWHTHRHTLLIVTQAHGALLPGVVRPHPGPVLGGDEVTAHRSNIPAHDRVAARRVHMPRQHPCARALASRAADRHARTASRCKHMTCATKRGESGCPRTAPRSPCPRPGSPGSHHGSSPSPRDPS